MARRCGRGVSSNAGLVELIGSRDSLDLVAYIRLTEEGSQVYVLMTSEDHCLSCLSCSLTPEGNGEFLARTTAEMIVHLERHRQAGSVVPDVAFARLRRDAAQNDLEMQMGR